MEIGNLVADWKGHVVSVAVIGEETDRLRLLIKYSNFYILPHMSNRDCIFRAKEWMLELAGLLLDGTPRIQHVVVEVKGTVGFDRCHGTTRRLGSDRPISFRMFGGGIHFGSLATEDTSPLN